MTADLHVHMLLDGSDYRAAIRTHEKTPQDALIRSRLEDYRARGVTFLRDGGDRWGVGLRARELARDYGIDYRTPVFPIYLQGHYGGFIGRGFSTEEEYRALLQEVRQAGGDFVKLMVSGLIAFSRPHQLTERPVEGRRICDMIRLAHEEGFAVMVHANGDDAVLPALEAGAESIEHGAYLSRETLLRLARSRTVWVPTLATIGDLIGCGRFPDAVLRPLLQEQQEKVRFAAQNGARIGLGSDAGAFRVLHGQGAADEALFLRQALGEDADPVLRAAETRVREVFHT